MKIGRDRVGGEGIGERRREKEEERGGERERSKREWPRSMEPSILLSSDGDQER